MRVLLLCGLLLCSLLSGVMPAYAVEDAMSRRLLPDDGKMILCDYGYRDWGPELVQYTVKTASAGAQVLLDSAGKAVPFQIDGTTLAFVAGVPRGGTATYSFQPSPTDRSAENSNLRVTKTGNVLEVGNQYLSLRVPAPSNTRTFWRQVVARAVAPPILQWANADGVWMGGARFVTARKFASQTFSVIRQGPAVFEYEARYRFSFKGEYVCRVQICANMPLASISEEFDLDAVTTGENMLVLDLHKGWQPQNISIVNGSGEQLLPTATTTPFAAYVTAKRKAAPPVAPVGGVGDAPAPFKPEAGWVMLEQIFPGGRWGALKGGIQLSDGAPGAGRNVAIVPLHLGSWRHAMALDAWYNDATGVKVCLPISVRLARWSLDVTDDLSPFSSHEHDSGLKFTYGRREWGLYVGSEVELAQPRYGYIGLDRYKDWVVDYPENPAVATYPGGLFNPDLIKQLRAAIDAHPLADTLKKRYLLSGKTDDAIANAREVIDRLKAPYGENDFFLNGLSNYRKVQLLMFVNRAEDALACPELPADLRQELRRRLALYANITSDPDFNPRGAGCHLGNNNMPINRTTALALFAPLLPDHPRYAYWMEQLRAFTAFKLQTQTAADGANIECPAYQLYAPSQGLNVALNALRNRGYDITGMRAHYKANLIFLANLTMPDPRWGGARIIPGMGNSSNLQESIWGVSMATFADDPLFAGWLKSFFKLCGQKFGPETYGTTCVGHAMYYLPGMADNPQPLATTFIPTYGVVFRNHFNTPNETAMLFRAGANWGHWDTDPLNVILYGKGAPLSPGTGYQYYFGPATQNNAVYHNQVKVGSYTQQEVFGRVDGTVTDYGFGSLADYAVASRYYPPELFKDGNGEMWWNRHVFFLKSEEDNGIDYFVLRDTFPSGDQRPTWWTWLNLDGAENISVDGTAFDPAKVAVDKIVPETDYPKLTGQTIDMRTKYGASTWMWFTQPRDVRIRMTFKAVGETKTIVEIPGTGATGYSCVVYPRRDGDPAPTCTAIAPGVTRIVTPESTDYVFIADEPFTYNKGDLTFTGKAGAIRLFPEYVVLCLNAGTGRVGYKGEIMEGNGPLEMSVPLLRLRKKVTPFPNEPVKQMARVELGNGVTITGEGPFTATLEGESIQIKTSGRARVLQVSKPPFMLRPQYWIDGIESMACWTDYPASGWGSYKNTWLISLSVPAGEHVLTVKNLSFPPVWTRPFTPHIDGVVPAK